MTGARELSGGLDAILHARSVAVVGASASPDKVGHFLLANIINGGYEGRVYPINPKASEILGLRAYPALSDVPEPVDLAVIAIPAILVPATLREAVAVGVRGAVVISGGFREAGHADLEAEVASIVRASGLRLIGPNCQGINYRPNKLCATWPLLTASGPFAVVSQSGTVAAAMAGWAVEEGLGISATVSLGNQVDLSETDMLDFFASDPATRAVAFYLEGVQDGRRFIQVLRRVAPQKPILILKSGCTSGGQRAAASHTRSLAGRDEVFGAVCRQFGAVRVPDLQSLYDDSKALVLMSPPRGNRLLVVTSSGGSGILAVDEAERHGLEVPALSSALIADLQAADVPATSVLANPLDLTMCTAANYDAALSAVIRHDVADAYLVIFGDPIPGAAEVVKRLRARTQAGVAVAFLGGGEVERAELPLMHAAGVPVFPTPERAVRAIASAVWWSTRFPRTGA